MWALDIKGKFDTVNYLLLKDYLEKLEPKGEKVLGLVSQTNGYRILVKEFETAAFVERHPDIIINKDK